MKEKVIHDRDARYISVGAYIRHKQDLIFKDIFKIIPKTVVSKDLGKQIKCFNELLHHPEELRLSEVQRMAKMFSVDLQLLLMCIFRQLDADGIF
jgi:hypothetical protein